jgi:HEAT repeat protein
MLQRSTWSGLLLSAAVFSTCCLTSAPAFGQDATPATPAAADAAASAPAAASVPAPTGPLKSLADDYLHYSLVNNVELAQANGQAILNANPAPKDLLAAFEDAANGRNPREIMIRDQERPELREVSAQLLDRLEEGYRSVARDPARIRTDIERLDNGPRAYNNARDHLVAAGQFAAPLFIEYLQNTSKPNLQPYILRVMGEIGRPLLLPLLEALQTNDPGIRIALVKVIGEIGYPQALPTLRALQTDSATTGELKNAVDQAISSIDRSGAAANASPAALFLKSANDYYDKKPSYQPLLLGEKTNPVWVFDKGLNNVAPLEVPTVIWTDVMALRNAEETLKLDGNNSAAISLWLAADLRREISLPAGATDPTHDSTKPEGAFYARAFGPLYVNPVLSRALDAHDVSLALRAIDALEATGGINGLVSASSGAPLVRALTYPDRDVRFRAAFALARANPTMSFPSAFRVVPTLAEALGSNEQPVALIVSPDEDVRNKLAEGLRGAATPYTVYTASSLSKALEESKTASTISTVIVASGPEADAIQSSAHTDHRLDSASVVVLAPSAQVKPWSGDRNSYKTVDEHADSAAVIAAIGAVSTAQGTGGGSAAANADYVKTSLALLQTIGADHKSIYSINDAVPALSNAIKDTDAGVVTAAANVLGELNNADAQRTLASAALASDASAALRAPLLDAVAESAKHTGNALDASAVNSLIKIVETEKDPAIRIAAATALGALNVPSNQASTLILQQSTVQ